LKKTFTLLALVALVAASVASRAAAEKPSKIKALLLTGGCCHDYDAQKKILTEGISERAAVEWTIVHEGGKSTDHKISIHEDPNWAKPYDVVVHNECFASVKDVDFIHRITDAHKQGVPAIVIHCGMHCYRGKTDEWFKFVGVTSRGHGAHHPIKVEVIERDHPIMKGLAGSWRTPKGELYNIESMGENAKALAKGVSDRPDKPNTCVWTNQYGKARVFGTTLGHHNETMERPVYLDMLARGLLWSVGKLTDDGKPYPGYEGTPTAPQQPGPEPTAAGDWSHEQVAKLPQGETPIHLFNGRDFEGWEGNTGKYFNVESGVIVAKNGTDDAPDVSNYLLTKKSYRNFRLIFESKLVTSEMHSGIAIWGKKFDKDGELFSYQGHLVMYPSGYGFYDLYRRNMIYTDKDGAAKKAGRQHDWNQMEILAIGNRIRHVINGKLVADWSDPKPELCQAGPIGLQLHSNKVSQEIHFRGLVLTEDPQDEIVTTD